MDRETKRSSGMRPAVLALALLGLCCGTQPGGGGDLVQSGGAGSGGASSDGATGAVSGSGGDAAVDGAGGGAAPDGGSRAPMGPPPVVTLFPDCEFAGPSATLTVGDYDAAALTERGFAAGDVSALRVTHGYKVILYSAPGFLGQSITLTASSACFADFAIASLRVRENLGSTSSGAGGGGGEEGPPPCTSNTPSEETCEPFGVILAGKYWVNNNLWGQDAGVGQQCMRRTCLGGDDIAFETDWSWSNSPSSVKSFGSAVLGWHWGYHVQATGLPVQLSSGGSVECGFSYSVNQSGTMNVAYDLWLHSVPDPQWGRPGVATDQPTDELMIWLYRAGGAAPIGTVQGPAVSIGGASWQVYRGAVTDNGQTLWNVYSFVRTTNTSSATLDLTDFTAEVVSRGWMPSSRYLTSVQAGPEVFVGTSSLTVSSFGCTTP